MNQPEQTLLDRYNCQDVEELIRYVDDLRYASEIGKGFIPISEVLPDCVIISNDRGSIIYANKVAHELFIYDQMVGMNVEFLMPERFRQDHNNALNGSRTSNSYLDRVAYMYALKSDGSEFPMSISLTKYRKNGEYNFIAIIRDASRAIKDIEVFKFILKDIPVMVAIFKENEEFEYTNNKFIEVLGTDAERLSHNIEIIMVDQFDVQDGIIHMYEDNQEWRKFRLKTTNNDIIETIWYNVKYEDKWIAFGLQLSELPSNENLLRRALDIVIEGKRQNNG